MALPLPQELKQSFLDYENYPLNIVVKGKDAYRSKLQSWKDKLDERESGLFLTNEKHIELPIRDLYGSAGTGKIPECECHLSRLIHVEVMKCNIHSFEKLDQWLQVNMLMDEEKSEPQTIAHHPGHPQCRFMYVLREFEKQSDRE